MNARVRRNILISAAPGTLWFIGLSPRMFNERQADDPSRVADEFSQARSMVQPAPFLTFKPIFCVIIVPATDVAVFSTLLLAAVDQDC